MRLGDKIKDHVSAAFTGLWIQTYEQEFCIQELRQYCADQEYRFATWNNEEGVDFPLEGTSPQPMAPMDVLKMSRDMTPRNGALGMSGLLVLSNFHFYTSPASDGGKKIVQMLQNVLSEGRSSRTFILVLSPFLDIPEELKSYFTIVKHDLPDREEVLEIIGRVGVDVEDLPTDKNELTFIGDAAAGFTRLAIENTFALCVIRARRERRLLDKRYPGWQAYQKDKDQEKLKELRQTKDISWRRLQFLSEPKALIDPDVIFEEKAKELQKLPGVVLLRDETACFADLGGLIGPKTFCLQALARRARKRSRAKGICLIGVPGAGKSQFCKALGNETKRPVLHVQLGQLKHENVGRSSANMGRMLDLADHMAPCIMFLDEIEKMMSSLLSAGSPVGGDMFQMLLTWMNDHTSDVFVVCTANRVEDVMQTSPEFFRAGRFNASFFVDMPSAEVKATIWDIYRKLYGRPEDEPLPEDANWTGAEIEGCCDVADLLNISLVEAAKQIVPVAVTAGDRINWLREWATNKVLSADHVGEIYQATRHSPKPVNGKHRNLGLRKKTAEDKE